MNSKREGKNTVSVWKGEEELLNKWKELIKNQGRGVKFFKEIIIQQNSTHQDAGYPDRLGPSG
jgi:hypothetical protein